MCSIFVTTGKGVSFAEAEKAFYETRSRGPDLSRFSEAGTGYVGFHRLAIMGLDHKGMQPFYDGDTFAVCNGELYGFRAVRASLEKEGFAFQSQSDCEILLPLYKKYGARMFAMLDAEFACVIYDAKKQIYLAARDPIGIRPLYYGYMPGGKIAFASEPKNLVSITEKVFPFPPGHYYENGAFVRYCDITHVSNVESAETDVLCKNIREKLIAGIEKRLDADAPLGFLLSGGLDSSLVCAVAQRLLKKPVRTFAIGMEKDAIDLKYAQEAADYIGSDHTSFIMTREEVFSSLETVIKALATFDLTTVRASMGMYLICKKIRESSDIRVLLTGEISDELFGYKYTDFAPDAQSFQAEAEKRVRELHMYDVLRADRCISVNSLEARVPFGDLDFVRYVMSIDPERKLNRYNTGKYLLRRAFEEGGYLPRSILYREKAAFSDAVGHSMVDDLKEYAQTLYGGDWERIAERYAYHCKPFTKEALLYREIFEKYYPEQAHMIADYWMPNRAWAGCDVNDPSARVLSNYGKSGQ